MAEGTPLSPFWSSSMMEEGGDGGVDAVIGAGPGGEVGSNKASRDDLSLDAMARR